MELTSVRHGEPAPGSNPDERFDPGLSARGRADAYCVAGFLVCEHHDALSTLPLRRARETAQPIAEATGLRRVVEGGLAEFDRKVGHTHYSELPATRDPRYDAYLSPWGSCKPSVSGVCSTVDVITERNPSQRVQLIRHGGVRNAFLAEALALSGMVVRVPAYASITRLSAGSGRHTVISSNETGRLRGIATVRLPDHVTR